MAGKVLRSYVHVANKNGEAVVLSPGQELPGWAKEQVTNPKAFSDGETVEQRSGQTTTEQEPSGYATLDNPALKAELKKRELPQSGNKAELIERLEKHDAEQKAAAAAAGGSGDGSSEGGARGDERAATGTEGSNNNEE